MIDKTVLKRLQEQCGVPMDYSNEILKFANACAKYATSELNEENVRLRAALANSELPCAYCTLSKEDWNKCQSGFPGCGRADDAMGCAELGASLELREVAAGKWLEYPENKPESQFEDHYLAWSGHCDRPICGRYDPIRWKAHKVKGFSKINPCVTENVEIEWEDHGKI